jgi:hypothetical protein
VLVQYGKLACASFPHDGMMLEMLVFMQEGKLAHVSFPHNAMMLFEMKLCLCKREITSFPPRWNDVV